ncbi:MAG: penicillin-binding protein 2 [Chthoniobacterales bacterium]
MNFRKWICTLSLATILSCVHGEAQVTAPAVPAPAPTVSRSDIPGEVNQNPKPTWETQKQAQTYQLAIPAPRGQITDRHGRPFAQTRFSYNLAINFPLPLNFPDRKVLSFTKQQITLAKALLKRDINISDAAILNHYKNRGILPLDIVEDLTPSEMRIVQEGLTPSLALRQTYVRSYPEKELAAHIIGYTGREAPLSVRPVENGDLIFPESEGREGVEQIFNEQLVGQKGQLNLTFDAEGNKTSERIAVQPVPGYSVITTIDENLQRICEKVLEQNTKRGAIVIIDPNTGEILAMASWPTFDPNLFIPIVKPDDFERLQNDPFDPLYPRAFRSAYPPGSIFKTVVGLAALQTGTVKPKDTYNCPATFDVGNVVFHNWKKEGAGRLTFVEALTQSCNTWFYQVGLKMGAKPIIEWANRVGLGRKTGIPLNAENKGNIPNDEYMLRVQKRKILSGDVANMSIGQGDILITPLQMAQAMGIIANGGVFHQTRLVKQIQSLDNKVVLAYPDRIRDTLNLNPGVISELHKAMVSVTENSNGTAHRAQVKGISVAGKTGTAQWGPKTKQRTAAWFVGFAPADKPQYAFAALYEGEPNDNSVHGGSQAAPLIGKVLKEVFNPDKKADDNKKPDENQGKDEDKDKDSSAPSDDQSD